MGDLATAARPASNAPAHGSDPHDAGGTAAAAAAAEAARVAAQPLDPATRAAEGFRIASGNVPDGSAVTQAVADAGANARNAMARPDAPPELKTVLERLGNAVIDGKLDPHMNGEFRQQLYNLATTDVKSGEYREALAHMTRAAQVLDQVPLAKGTQLAYDAKAGADLSRAGLPGLDVPKLDADLAYQRRDGTQVIESSKYGASTFASEVQDSRKGKSNQLERQAQWEAKGTTAQPREARFFMLDKSQGFGALLDNKNLDELGKHVGQPDQRNIVIGDRAYSLNELKALDARGQVVADAHVAQQAAIHKASGKAGDFDKGEAYKAFYKEALANPESAMKAYGMTVGEPVKGLKALAQPEVGNLRQAGLAGAAGAGVIQLAQLAFKGDKVTVQDLGHASVETLKGGAIGAVAAKAEQYVIPAVERRIGTAVETKVAQVAAGRLGQSAAASAGTGVLAKTAASRLVGSTAVGTVIATGMSAWENREGLKKGDSKAIGNVTADTVVGAVAVGASSVAGAAAAGALAGSVVPGLGTAVGFGVGLAVGVGIAYGAQISGARDAIAHGAGKAVDWVKGWF